MAKIDKIINKMKCQPNGIRYKDAERVLRHFKFDVDYKSGSHVVFRKTIELTIPRHGKTIKSVYVREILSAIEL